MVVKVKGSLVLLALSVLVIRMTEGRTSPRSLTHPRKTGMWKSPHGLHRKTNKLHPLKEVRRFPKLDSLNNHLEGLIKPPGAETPVSEAPFTPSAADWMSRYTYNARHLEGRMRAPVTEAPVSEAPTTPSAADWMSRYTYNTRHKVRHVGGRELHEEVVLELQQDQTTPSPSLNEADQWLWNGVQNEDANHVLSNVQYSPVVLRPAQYRNNTSLSVESVEKDLFKAHRQRLNLKCKHPIPKVIHLRPDPGQVLDPHCTILHRCGEDTGCCSSIDYTCAARNISMVDLYFQVTSVKDKRQRYVKKVMENHTECECRRRSLLDEPVVLYGDQSQQSEQNLQTLVVPRRKREQCVCPYEYSVKYLPDGQCSCDCFDSDKKCLNLKRGKIHFSYMDQLCIRDETCLLPSCEYGEYLNKSNRCRKKNEGAYHRHSQINPRTQMKPRLT